MTGAEMIAAERRRQIEEKGYTDEHDAQHDPASLVWGALYYAMPYGEVSPVGGGISITPEDFFLRTGWGLEHMGRFDKTGVEHLVVAGALLAAAIDRVLGQSGTEAAPPRRNCPAEEVAAEIRRAVAKYPCWPTDPLHALAVLGEEFGELTRAMLQLSYEPHKTTPEQVRTEAVQTAAMAMRLVSSLNRYRYRRGEQHVQE